MAPYSDEHLKQEQEKAKALEGKAEQLRLDAAAEAAKAAKEAEEQAHEAEAAALQEALDKGAESDGDVTGADETFISAKDLDFLNSK